MSYAYVRTEDGDLAFGIELESEAGQIGDEIFRLEAGSDLGILYTMDGVLHKHGPVEMVSERLEDMRSKLDMSDPGAQLIMSEMLLLRLPVSALTDEMVEEINLCLDITGRVAKLSDRLADMATGASPSPG